MNQIESIQLGVIAICIETVPLSLAQTPRGRTSGSNQTSTTSAAAGIGGSSGDPTGVTQTGIMPRLARTGSLKHRLVLPPRREASSTLLSLEQPQR